VAFTQKVPAVQILKYQEQNGGRELDVRETQDDLGVVLPLKHSSQSLIVNL